MNATSAATIVSLMVSRAKLQPIVPLAMIIAVATWITVWLKVRDTCARTGLPITYSFTKRPKLEFELLGSLSKDHVLHNTFSIEPNIKIIALDVQTGEVHEDQKQAAGFRVIPVILKQLLTVH